MSEHGFDLPAYLARIGHTGPVEPTAECLEAVHVGHATHIPFENLEIHLDRPMPLDLESLQRLLIGARRGGYCFQMNRLFSAALSAIGLEHSLLRARVWLGNAGVPPAGHQLLAVRTGTQTWLADVGFGGGGLLRPMPMRAGEEMQQGFRRFRLRDAGEFGMMLQRLDDGQWRDQYSFESRPCHLVDYEFANYYLSTSPDSFFFQNRTCSILGPDRVVTMFNNIFHFQGEAGVEERQIEDGLEYLAALKEHFGIDLGAGDSLRAPGRPAA